MEYRDLVRLFSLLTCYIVNTFCLSSCPTPTLGITDIFDAHAHIPFPPGTWAHTLSSCLIIVFLDSLSKEGHYCLCTSCGIVSHATIGVDWIHHVCILTCTWSKAAYMHQWVDSFFLSSNHTVALFSQPLSHQMPHSPSMARRSRPLCSPYTCPDLDLSRGLDDIHVACARKTKMPSPKYVFFILYIIGH